MRISVLRVVLMWENNKCGIALHFVVRNILFRDCLYPQWGRHNFIHLFL